MPSGKSFYSASIARWRWIFVLSLTSVPNPTVEAKTCPYRGFKPKTGGIRIITFRVIFFRKYIEDLNLRPAVKKAIMLLSYLTNIKVLEDALAHLGPYQTLTSVRYNDPGG